MNINLGTKICHCLMLIYICVFSVCVFGNEQNTSSPHFRYIASKVISQILPCIQSSPRYDHSKNISYHFPIDGEEHFALLKNITKKYQTKDYKSVFYWSGWGGPWMENHFLMKFANEPLYKFRGIFPLFVQFLDIQVRGGENEYNPMISDLAKVIRPDCLYLMVNFQDDGVKALFHQFPNILSMSSGGYGHIPLPNIKGEIPYSSPPAQYEHDIGFFGQVYEFPEFCNRTHMMSTIEKTAGKLNMTIAIGQSSQWLFDMTQTKFNLAPRGQGRTSFRLSEAVQMGRIPVYLYNDVDWSPYKGTKYDLSTYGFRAKMTEKAGGNNEVIQLLQRLKTLPHEEYAQKMKNLTDVRHHHTYEGVMHQIHLFLQDPFGAHGGELRCAAPIPKTTLCCDNNDR